MQKTKKQWRVKRTPLLRMAALLAAVAIVGVLGYTVNRQVGNPVSAWYTARKIAAHYNAYHPGEGYVVGPAQYQYLDADNSQNWRQRYACPVYKTGSIDTGFVAVYERGAVLQCESATTKSGSNTYNRFKNRLNDELANAGARDALGLAETDTLLADFYEPDNSRDLFNPAAPAFKPDAVFDRAALPLKSVLYLGRYSEQPEGVSEQSLVELLCRMREFAEASGQPFDFYSVELYSPGGAAIAAFDVPAAELADREKADAYVTGLSAMEKSGSSSMFYENTVAMRKMKRLSTSGYEVCTH